MRGPGGAVVNYLMGAQLDGPMVILTLAAGGALDRFPELQVVTVETGASWLAWIMTQADAIYADHSMYASAEAVAEAERADPPPVRGHVHVRPGRDQQPRDHRRRDAHVGQRLPAPRRHVARVASASTRDQFDGVEPTKTSTPSSAATPPASSASTSTSSPSSNPSPYDRARHRGESRLRRSRPLGRSERTRATVKGQWPTSAADVTPVWLTAALAARHPGADLDAVEVLDQNEVTNAHARLRVTYRPGAAPRDDVLQAPAERRATGQIIATGMGHREARFYAELAPSIAMRVPEAHVARTDDDGRFVLLLEDLVTTGCDGLGRHLGASRSTPPPAHSKTSRRCTSASTIRRAAPPKPRGCT